MICPYEAAPVRECEVTVEGEQRAACLAMPSNRPHLMRLHCPCDCGYGECLGVIFTFEMDYERNCIRSEDGAVKIKFEQTAAGFVLREAASGLKELRDRERPESTWQPTVRSPGGIYPNPAIQAWD